MAFDLNAVQRGVSQKPPRLTVYGPHGIGKTTFLSQAPNPLILQTEDGEGLLDVARTGVLTTWAQVQDVLGALYTDEHQFATLGIDTIDWLEPIVWAEACARNGWKDIETPGYGKGYLEANTVWREMFEGLKALRDHRGMAVILLAHAEVKVFNDPAADPYDRYQIKLQKGASALMQEWADAVLFANWKSYTVKTDAGFNKKVTRGVGSGERVLLTEERPSHYAKNRYGLPPELPFAYASFEAAMYPAPAQPATTTQA